MEGEAVAVPTTASGSGCVVKLPSEEYNDHTELVTLASRAARGGEDLINVSSEDIGVFERMMKLAVMGEHMYSGNNITPSKERRSVSWTVVWAPGHRNKGNEWYSRRSVTLQPLKNHPPLSQG